MAGEATFHYGDFRQNLTVCTGLAGGGELLLDLWRVTGDAHWQQRALEFGRMILGELSPEGDAWPTDEPGLFSPDFLYGASGAGYFLLRLETDGQLAPALFGRSW
jgi:hypothetical protein